MITAFMLKIVTDALAAEKLRQLSGPVLTENAIDAFGVHKRRAIVDQAAAILKALDSAGYLK